MKRKRILVLILVVSCLNLLPRSGFAATITRMTVASYAQNEPMVAINPMNYSKLVVGFNDNRSGNYRVGWAWSDNDGANWTFGGNFTFAGYARGADPVVAFDNAGTAYMAGLAYNPDTSPSLGRDGSIFLAKSNDGGHTFTVFKKLVITGTGTATYYDKPWLHINPTNNPIYLSWVRRNNAWGVGGTEATTIEFVRSIDGGGSFSAPLQVSTFNPATGANRSHGPQIAAGPGNAVYVAWHTLENGVPGGAAWQPPRIWIAESADGGQTFGPNRLVMAQQKGLPNRFISLGVNRTSGRIYVAYADRQNYPGDYDVYVATSTATAGPWTSTRINDNTLGGQFWPALAVAPNGRVDVIWYDQRDDINRLQVYSTYSLPGGVTWAANSKITDLSIGFDPVPATTFAGDYMCVVSLDDKAYAAWMDNRNGNQEIYGTTIVHTPPGAPGAPSNLRIIE